MKTNKLQNQMKRTFYLIVVAVLFIHQTLLKCHQTSHLLLVLFLYPVIHFLLKYA